MKYENITELIWRKAWIQQLLLLFPLVVVFLLLQSSGHYRAQHFYVHHCHRAGTIRGTTTGQGVSQLLSKDNELWQNCRAPEMCNILLALPWSSCMTLDMTLCFLLSGFFSAFERNAFETENFFQNRPFHTGHLIRVQYKLRYLINHNTIFNYRCIPWG